MTLINEDDEDGKKEGKTEQAQPSNDKKEWWPKKEAQKKGGKPNKAQIKKEVKCHGFGALGHFVRECRKMKKACFNCGQVGHFTK